MREHKILKHISDSLPPEKRRLLQSAATLPPDVLKGASKRLALLSLVMTGLLCLYLIIYTFVPLLGGPRIGEPFGLMDLILIATIVPSFAIFLLARSERLKPQQMLDLGLLFEIVLAFVAGVALRLTPGPLHIPSGWGISDICILILIFPVIVPNTPWKILLAALVAASMDPLGVFLAVAMGKSIPPGANLFLAYFSNYICAALALVPSFILIHLSREVSHAREMGSYRLKELLGRGGMGEVWRAEHRLLARPAAIKLIRPEVLRGHDGQEPDVVLKRFQLEAQATAAMRSPHTIQLFDFGVTDNGAFYYVMELLEGFDLQSLVKRFGPMPFARAVHFLRQACHSLGEAHENSLIHRDIKPANAFTCRYGREVDFIKILDFGLVKPQRKARAAAQITAAGEVSGTPEFMAPEQVLGDRPVDARTDIYALGCLGYWLLTGQLVFTGDTAMQIMVHHAQTLPVAPSQQTELDIPSSLDDVILSCLAKDSAQRPQSADALAARLSTCVTEQQWTAERAHEWWDTHLPRSVPAVTPGVA